MSSVEKISERIASEISKNISMDEDKEEVIAYGAFVLIQTILTIITIAIFGAVFHTLIEIILISTTAAILRKFSGGAHATKAINCILICLIVFGGLALIVKHFIINLNSIYLMLLILISFIFSFYIIYKYAPVGTANKPLKNKDTRIRLKRKSIMFAICVFIANIILLLVYSLTRQFFLLNIAVCISIGVVWQSLTLVSLGHKIIDLLDKVLGGTLKLMRRTN